MNPNGHSNFQSKTLNFTVVLKRPFVLLLRNTKFLKLLRNFNLLFDNKFKNLKLPPNCHSFFEHEIQILKLYPDGISLLNTNSESRNLIFLNFYNEFLVIQKNPTELLGNYLLVN